MKTQSGNALFMILIAIFLLGAVTALIARSSGTSEETGSTEKMTIAASNALRYAGGVQMAVQQLMSRGCGENEISFENDITGSQNYTNTTAPDDERCNVFSPRGGGMKYQLLDTALFDSAAVNNSQGHPYFFVAHALKDAGTGKADLLLFYNGLTKEFCVNINRVLGIANTNGSPPDVKLGSDPSAGTGFFQGTFGTGTPLPAIEGAALQGKKAGCMRRIDEGNFYQFFFLLYAK